MHHLPHPPLGDLPDFMTPFSGQPLGPIPPSLFSPPTSLLHSDSSRRLPSSRAGLLTPSSSASRATCHMSTPLGRGGGLKDGSGWPWSLRPRFLLEPPPTRPLLREASPSSLHGQSRKSKPEAAPTGKLRKAGTSAQELRFLHWPMPRFHREPGRCRTYSRRGRQATYTWT